MTRGRTRLAISALRRWGTSEHLCSSPGSRQETVTTPGISHREWDAHKITGRDGGVEVRDCHLGSGFKITPLQL